MAAGTLDEDFYLYGDQVLKSPEDRKDTTRLSITENGTERPTTPTLDDEMDSLLGAAPQAPITRIVSNAPDLQPKAPAAAAQETEDAASEELEDVEEDEEESESDDDDVQITIDAIQPTPIPYGRTPSYTRMSLQPGGVGGPGVAKKVDLEAVPQIGGQSLYEVELDPDKPWKMPGADVTDYFNYGFTEETWKLYCEKQRKLRGEVASLNKIVVHSARGGPLDSSDSKNIVNVLPALSTPTGNFLPSSIMASGPPPPPGPMYPPPPPAPSSQVGTPTQIMPGPGVFTPPHGTSEEGGKTPDADDQVSDGRATPGIDMDAGHTAGKAPLLPPPVSGPAVLPSMPPPHPFGIGPGIPPPNFPGIRGQDNVAAAMAAMFGVRPPEVIPPPMHHHGMPPFPPPGFPGGMPGPETVIPPFHGIPPPFHMHGDRGPGPMDHMVPPDMMPPGMHGQFPWDPTLGPPPPEMIEGFQMRPDRRSGSRSVSSSASRSRSRSSSYEDHSRSNRKKRHRRERRSKSRSHSRDRHRSSRYHRTSEHHRSDRHRDRDRDRERERDRDRDRERDRERERERDRDREKRRRDRKEKEERSRHERSSRRHRSSSRDREEERSSRKDKSKSSGDKELSRDSRSRSQTPT